MSLAHVIRRFDNAAPHYDAAASAQARIAANLVDWASGKILEPACILDIGSGTGFVAEKLHRLWQHAHITALDASPSMLREAKKKLPHLTVLVGDALAFEPKQKYDAIFSSMALHWLPDPLQALRYWQGQLNPDGMIFAALPVAGSFREWHALCREHKVENGLWILPPEDFADAVARKVAVEEMTVIYPSARAFLQSMKSAGASTSRAGHKPTNIAQMRAMLNTGNRTFPLTYRLAFLQIPESDP